MVTFVTLLMINKHQLLTRSSTISIVHFCSKPNVFCGVSNHFIASPSITSTFVCLSNMNVKRLKPAMKSTKSASVTKDTIQHISQLINKKRTRSVLKSLPNNKTQSKPVFARKLQRPHSGNLDVNLHKVSTLPSRPLPFDVP